MARKPTAAERQLTADYLDYLESLEARATDAICGVWYNKRGAARHAAGLLSQWDMFRRPWAQVACYASEELTGFFQSYGRVSFTEYREQVREANREAYAAYLDAA